MIGRDYLDALRGLPEGTLSDLTANAPFLVMAPHADDETLGCGGIIAASCAAGIQPCVMIVTDGSASHPGSRAYPPERLAALRSDEARHAMLALGLAPENLSFLGLRDAAAPASGPDFDASVSAIADQAARAGAASLFVTSGLDPHRDHETASAMARAVAAHHANLALWAYPIWSLHIDPDAEVSGASPIGLRVDVSAQAERKGRALDCYASQMTSLIADDPDGFRFTERTIAPFTGRFETLIRVKP